MACHVDKTQYDVHMYEGYPPEAESCWENSNVYLVEPNNAGKPSQTKVTKPETGKKYFFAAKVTSNVNPVPDVLEMQFGAPTWIEDGTTEVKTVFFDGKGFGRPGSSSKVYHSKDAIEFLHQGNYEIFAQIKKWEGIPEDQVQSDWPKSGPLYARDSIFVIKA